MCSAYEYSSRFSNKGSAWRPVADHLDLERISGMGLLFAGRLAADVAHTACRQLN